MLVKAPLALPTNHIDIRAAPARLLVLSSADVNAVRAHYIQEEKRVTKMR